MSSSEIINIDWEEATMSEKKLPDVNSIDLDKEVSFTYPDGLLEAAAVLDFLADDEEKVKFVKALSRTLQ